MRFTLWGLVLLLLTNVALFAQQDDEEKDKKTFEQTVVITANRLPGEEQDKDKVPTNTIIITSEQIEDTGATNMQELLSTLAGILMFDQVGNGKQTTVGLRGFADGGSTAVYLDGVRLNDIYNSVNLEFIDPAIIERIEVVPGGASNSRGNGALAGSINIITKHGDGPLMLRASGMVGSFETYGGAASVSAGQNGHSFLASVRYEDSDGWRDNDASEETNLFGKYRYADDRFSAALSYRYYTGDIGSPGALTLDEIAEDRTQTPFNMIDFFNSDEYVISGQASYLVMDGLTLSAVAFYRDLQNESLSTGRSAALYGGFLSDTDSDYKGIAVQASYKYEENAIALSTSAGIDYSEDNHANVGSGTDINGDITYLSSDRNTKQDNFAVFGQAAVTFNDLFTVSGNVRYDSLELSFTDNVDSREEEKNFDETTASVGASFKINEFGSIYARYAQAFQTPSVSDLFAYPGFGSNPDLVPTTGDTYEGGIRFNFENTWFLQASLFRMDLENEVVYVIINPIYYIGENQNIGESRRSGAEVTLTAFPTPNLDIRANYTYTMSENITEEESSGLDDLEIPLVPNHKFTVSANGRFADFKFGGDLIYVGEQILDSDLTNSAEPLESYFVANLRASFEQLHYAIRLEVRNLLDEEYATRGILAYSQPFLTPAQERSVRGWLEVRF